MDSDANFFDPAGHFEALALLASTHLYNGDPAAAFPFADRRCRITKPGVQELLLRAEASRLAGYSEFAEADLAAAVEIDPTDEMLNVRVLSWGSPGERPRAAERLIASRNVGSGALALAVETLMRAGERAIHKLERKGPEIEGWVVWEGSDELELRAHGAEGTQLRVLQRDEAHPLTSGRASAANVDWRDDGANLRSFDFALEGRVVARVSAPRPPAARRARIDPVALEPSAPVAALVNVIVPVYDDLESTRACLTSLIEQKSETAFRIIVVDDRSPNDEIRAYLGRVARRHDLLLIRNEWNLGYAGAVNEALAHCATGDVLLLNADTLLPPGVIDRLAAVAHSAADIGAVTPFSNNGELTSYPEPNFANPIDSPPRVVEVDRCAARANGAGLIDVPNGVGFCLYIKRSCLDAVGPLSAAYSRGYYEDVEFCLKAGELGFRNVCATGIFVGHVGTRSFGADKRALVVRNLAILSTRFPEYKLRYAAFVEADPLKPARSAIDRLLPPAEEDILLLASGQGASRFLARMRARDILVRDERRTVLHVTADADGDRVELFRASPGAPRSLRFSLLDASELVELRNYLTKLRAVRLEIFDPAALPERVLRELLALGTPVDVICGDLEWFRGELSFPDGPCGDSEADRPCDACDARFLEPVVPSEENSARRARLSLALSRADSVTPMDRMSEAFSRRVFKGKAAALEPVDFVGSSRSGRLGENPALGLIAPIPTAAVDRLVLRLGRLFALRRIEIPIVVLGRCLDDLALMAVGDVFVTGPAQTDEYERLVAQYQIGALALPYRTAFFGVLDRLAQATATPKAYFDWSFGSLAAEADDLSLDPRICDEKAAASLAIWVRALYGKTSE